MKITNSDLIKNREKELLETIPGDLDRDSIKQLLVAKYHMELDGDSLSCRDADLVVYDNQVAYKLNFEAVMTLSLLFNRQGECLEIKPSVKDVVTEKTTEIPESVANAAVSVEDAEDKADMHPEAPVDETNVPEEYGRQESHAGGDNPAAGMASTIADMISEINKV